MINTTDPHLPDPITMPSNQTADIPAGLDLFNEILSCVVTACSVIGVFLNICVIRHSRLLRRSTGDLTHAFICSMASADLLLCLCAQPFEFVLQKLHLISPEWICRLQHMLYWLGYSASGLSLTMLNLDKLLFFRWPLHYGMLGTRNTAKWSILTCWTTCCMGAVIMVLPSVLQLSKTGDCGTDNISIEPYIIYTCFFCILPVLSSAVVSAYLAHLVSTLRRNSTQNRETLNDYTVQQRLKAMVYIFIATAWTFLALTPFRVFNIVRLYYYESWSKDRWTLFTAYWIGYIFLYLLAFNPLVNPLLTLTTYAQYKNMFIRKILMWKEGCICRRKKRQATMNDNIMFHHSRTSIVHNQWL